MIPLHKINKEWTLFLDRDGVINHEGIGTYINSWADFKFYDGAKEAFTILSGIFNKIIIVTNQRGVAKGITKEEELKLIHKNMVSEITEHGGRVDAVYYCPDADSDSPRRKPNPGMGLQAAKDFPDIDFSKSVMVGNNISDMHFGRNLGAYTVFLPTTRAGETDLCDPAIDAVFPTLAKFAEAFV